MVDCPVKAGIAIFVVYPVYCVRLRKWKSFRNIPLMTTGTVTNDWADARIGSEARAALVLRRILADLRIFSSRDLATRW